MRGFRGVAFGLDESLDEWFLKEWVKGGGWIGEGEGVDVVIVLCCAMQRIGWDFSWHQKRGRFPGAFRGYMRATVECVLPWRRSGHYHGGF